MANLDDVEDERGSNDEWRLRKLPSGPVARNRSIGVNQKDDVGVDLDSVASAKRVSSPSAASRHHRHARQ
jgi:hypothetical protein